MAEVYHALGLHMHQPLGNLVALHNSGESWEARQILWCYDRPVRMLEGYEDVARLHLSFSGTLLKQLEDPGVRQTFGDVVNVEDFLNRYRRSNIEFLGSGLYHPVYPLVPPGGLGRADGLVAGAGAAFARAGEVPGLLAAGDGFLHGDDPAAGAAWIQIRARGFHLHQTQARDAVGGAKIPPLPRALPGLGDHRRAP